MDPEAPGNVFKLVLGQTNVTEEDRRRKNFQPDQLAKKLQIQHGIQKREVKVRFCGKWVPLQGDFLCHLLKRPCQESSCQTIAKIKSNYFSLAATEPCNCKEGIFQASKIV